MIYEKIISYCRENNLKISSLEKECGIGNGTISMWKHGAEPSMKTLRKIEKTTGIPISEWIN